MGKEVNDTPCNNPVEDEQDAKPIHLQGEIIDGESRQSISEANTDSAPAYFVTIGYISKPCLA